MQDMSQFGLNSYLINKYIFYNIFYNILIITSFLFDK